MRQRVNSFGIAQMMWAANKKNGNKQKKKNAQTSPFVGDE